MTKTPINFSAASLLGCWAVALWLGGKTALAQGGKTRCARWGKGWGGAAWPGHAPQDGRGEGSQMSHGGKASGRGVCAPVAYESHRPRAQGHLHHPLQCLAACPTRCLHRHAIDDCDEVAGKIGGVCISRQITVR